MTARQLEFLVRVPFTVRDCGLERDPPDGYISLFVDIRGWHPAYWLVRAWQLVTGRK